MSLISIQTVSKSYWRDSLEIPVLNNISFEIPEGEFLGLMGPSGSGKTTLLNLIAGIDRPTKGAIKVSEADITTLNESDLAKWRARHVGFIFQFYNLLPVLTAFENVELPLLLSKLTKKERKEHVEFALGVVGLGDRIHHYPADNSREDRNSAWRLPAPSSRTRSSSSPTSRRATWIVCRHRKFSICSIGLIPNSRKRSVMVTHDPRAAEKAHTLRHLDKGELS